MPHLALVTQVTTSRQNASFPHLASVMQVTSSRRCRRGGNRSTRRKPLATSFRKCHILESEDSSPKRDSNPHNSIGGGLGKQTCESLHHASPLCYLRHLNQPQLPDRTQNNRPAITNASRTPKQSRDRFDVRAWLFISGVMPVTPQVV